jgi:hypothetical protein
MTVKFGSAKRRIADVLDRNKMFHALQWKRIFAALLHKSVEGIHVVNPV